MARTGPAKKWRAKVIDALPAPKVSAEQIRSWKIMVGHAVTLSLLGKNEDAETALSKEEDFIATRATEVAKGWYVKAVLIVITVLMITAGYSERMVPSILWQVESTVTDSEKDQRFKDPRFNEGNDKQGRLPQPDLKARRGPRESTIDTAKIGSAQFRLWFANLVVF